MPVYALVSARSIDALVNRCETRRGAARERYARGAWLFKRARGFVIDFALIIIVRRSRPRDCVPTTSDDFRYG